MKLYYRPRVCKKICVYYVYYVMVLKRTQKNERGFKKSDLSQHTHYVRIWINCFSRVVQFRFDSIQYGCGQVWHWQTTTYNYFNDSPREFMRWFMQDYNIINNAKKKLAFLNVVLYAFGFDILSFVLDWDHHHDHLNFII